MNFILVDLIRNFGHFSNDVIKYHPSIGCEKVRLSHLVPPTTGPLMLKCTLISAVVAPAAAKWWFTLTPTLSEQLWDVSNWNDSPL